MNPQAMDQEKDLRYYWQALLIRKHYFFWPGLSIMLISLLAPLLLPSIYDSKSTILIEEQQMPPNFARSTITGYADQRIQSLNQQIISAPSSWKSSSSLTCMSTSKRGNPRKKLSTRCVMILTST
jgi:succinoglycan biosynthesis transport protein ExoP